MGGTIRSRWIETGRSRKPAAGWPPPPASPRRSSCSAPTREAIEQEVENRVAESVRLRDAVGDVGMPVDVIVLDKALASRRAKVPGTMVHHALRDGRILAGA